MQMAVAAAVAAANKAFYHSVPRRANLVTRRFHVQYIETSHYEYPKMNSHKWSI